VQHHQFFGNWSGDAHGVGVHADRDSGREVIDHSDRDGSRR
jgi:hypothetical protein